MSIRVSDVGYVINYDFPNNCEDYIHRIGRTGRAGMKGTSFTYFTTDNAKSARELVNILKEAKAVVPPQLEEMTMYGGGGGRSRYGGGGRGRGGGGGRFGGGGGGYGGGDSGYGGRKDRWYCIIIWNPITLRVNGSSSTICTVTFAAPSLRLYDTSERIDLRLVAPSSTCTLLAEVLGLSAWDPRFNAVELRSIAHRPTAGRRRSPLATWLLSFTALSTSLSGSGWLPVSSTRPTDISFAVTIWMTLRETSTR
ncbi:uncharacterized protein BT62DRAFT_1000242 [Guyanagaster necrorhizus]|uniref:Helicase C-terminal domain-containing protein n=1 Tax=Guyanagaster necrorhizus TaxID=856835 RepID=A0A9P7W0F5_9AGAR|nr:uncharacterized protein BT62DRAFT_1000242 [Guyanagaster necrorhizus MCA 3950]KAG7451006.1 hypothetical protein BT62DRAFT_1000242 [Guyanagaster necrorhizus MCA 3950]